MTHILPHNGETVVLHILLDGGGNVAQSVPFGGLGNAFKKALPGHIDQALRFFGDLPAGEGGATVAVVSAKERAHVDADDIALLQHPLSGNAVDNFIVHRRTDAGRKPVVVQKRRDRALCTDKIVYRPVNLLCRYAGTDHGACQSARGRGQSAGAAHGLDLMGRFQRNHTFCPNASRIFWVVPSTVAWLNISFRLPFLA